MSDLDQAFREYHAQNPAVWSLFERFALEAARAGRTHFGAKAVWERMRWHIQFETRDSLADWKLNNNYTSRYARMFAERHPEFRKLFQFRELRSSDPEPVWDAETGELFGRAS